MSFSERLLRHASDIIPDPQNDDITDDVCLRRAVSASYYAVFHLINEDAVRILAPNVTTETSYRIQRWFEHAKMKEIAVAAWNRIKKTGEANIFILSLLLWKNWEKDR